MDIDKLGSFKYFIVVKPTLALLVEFDIQFEMAIKFGKGLSDLIFAKLLKHFIKITVCFRTRRRSLRLGSYSGRSSV